MAQNYASECRRRDFAFILGNDKTNYTSLVQDGNAYDVALAGLVEYNSATTTGFIAGLDQTTCLATIFYKLGSIERVKAVRVQRDT